MPQYNAYQDPAENRSLPSSISQERLEKFKSGGNAQAGLSEKALLHDLDSKFDNQDRMINFMLQ